MSAVRLVVALPLLIGGAQSRPPARSLPAEFGPWVGGSDHGRFAATLPFRRYIGSGRSTHRFRKTSPRPRRQIPPLSVQSQSDLSRVFLAGARHRLLLDNLWLADARGGRERHVVHGHPQGVLARAQVWRRVSGLQTGVGRWLQSRPKSTGRIQRAASGPGAEQGIYAGCRSVSGAGYPRIRSIATTWPLW